MNEIEKQFFECIGIEPKKLFSARQGINPDAVIYPEITARKLLELICILNNLTGRLIELCSDDINTLKEEILKICLSNFEVFRLSYKNEFIKQVQKLFEE